MPRHLNDADLPQITVTSSTEAPNLGTLLGSENFDSGTIGTDIEPATFLTDAFYTGDLTFEAGGYTGQKAYCVAAGSHFIEHSLGGVNPTWRDAGTVVVKFKVSALPTSQWTVLGGMQNAPNEDYVFGINTVGNIGIGYVNPSTSYKTTYAVAPDEWVKVAFTYENNDTLVLRLWHGANINGSTPDEIINSPQGSFQNLRYVIFGKNEGWGNSVAVSYDDLYVYHGVPDWDTTLPQRSGLQFAGAGISSMVDNPTTRSTDITVANNPSSVEFEGGIQWELSGQTLGPGSDDLNLGTLSADDGSATWFDSGGSDLANGLVTFAEEGLYRAALHVTFAGDVPYTYDPEDLFSVMMRVYNPDDSLRYDVIRPVLQIKKENAGADTWSGDANFTDVMEVGGYIRFYRTGSDQMRSRPNVLVRAAIRKLV
jgi:hypothetical protein